MKNRSFRAIRTMVGSFFFAKIPSCGRRRAVRTKKKTSIILLSILVLASIALLASKMIGRSTVGSIAEPADTVAWVNGEPVGREELETIVSLMPDRPPAAGTLTEEVKRQLSRVKTIQQEAVRNRLLQDSSYSYFLDEWQEENERRTSALEKKEVIYGPKQYTELAYYDYRQSSLVNALQKLWADRGADLSDTSLRAFYEQHREEIARKPDKVTVFELLEPLSQGADARTAAEKRIDTVRSELAGGADFVELYKSRLKQGVGAAAETIDGENASETAKYRSEFYQTVMEMKAGETSGILEMNGALAILYVAERASGGYKSFEETREEVRTQYLNAGLDAYISGLASGAQIRLAPSQAAMKEE